MLPFRSSAAKSAVSSSSTATVASLISGFLNESLRGAKTKSTNTKATSKTRAPSKATATQTSKSSSSKPAATKSSSTKTTVEKKRASSTTSATTKSKPSSKAVSPKKAATGKQKVDPVAKTKLEPKGKKVLKQKEQSSASESSFIRRDVMAASPIIDKMIQQQEQEETTTTKIKIHQQNQKDLRQSSSTTNNNDDAFEVIDENNNIEDNDGDTSSLPPTTALSSSFATGNRINWAEVQEKVQYFNVALASDPSPGVKGEVSSQGRNLIKSMESTFRFKADDARACAAEHDDTLTVSIAIDLINAALRFSVPPSAPFVSGLMTFLRDAVSSSARGTTSSTSPLAITYIVQIINGASTVASLRAWDEQLFQRYPKEMTRMFETNSTLRDVVNILNGIGSKPLGATRSILNDAAEAAAAVSSPYGKKQLKYQQVIEDTTDQSAKSASSTFSASNLIPNFFEAIMQCGDSFVETALQEYRSSKKTSSSSSSSEQSTIDNVIDTVSKLADAPIATDSMMRSRLRLWIGKIVAACPPANTLDTLTTAATTIRLDNVFFPTLAATYKLRDELSKDQLAKTFSSLMMLPRAPFFEIKVLSSTTGKNASSLSSSSSSILLDPSSFSSNNINKISVRAIAERAREHMWGVVGDEELPKEVNLSVVVVNNTVDDSSNDTTTSTMTYKELDASKPFFPQVSQSKSPAGVTTIVISEGSGQDPKSLIDFEDSVSSSSSSSASARSDIFIPDKLICEIARSISSPGQLQTVSEVSEMSTNIVSFLAGAVALQVQNHAAVLWIADFLYNTVLSSSTGKQQQQKQQDYFQGDQDARLSSEMEFLAVATNFITRAQSNILLQSVLTKVQSKHLRYRKALEEHADLGQTVLNSAIFGKSASVNLENKKVAEVLRTIRLSANQLRLLSCSTLAVRHNLSPEIATFMLENLFKTVGDCSLPDISSVLYSVGRVGLQVSEAVHIAIGKRIGTILKFSRASRRFASLKSSSGDNTSSSSGLTSSSANAFISPHDLAVAFSGLHLTRAKWDRMPNVFIELSEALRTRAKRFTPAQCCQLVAIARDIARTAQNRGNNQLSNEATTLARTFLPQIRQSIPSATEHDLLPLLAWLSTGHIRDVNLLDSIIDRLISLNANPAVCVSVLDSIHSMGLLGGIASDGVFRLIQVIQKQHEREKTGLVNSSTKVTSAKPSVPQQDASSSFSPEQQQPQTESTSASSSISTSQQAMMMSADEQNAQLAFYATQLRSRDADLIRSLVSKSKNARSIKSLCSAIGSLSIIGASNAKSELMRHFTELVEKTLVASEEWEKAMQEERGVNLSEGRGLIDLNVGKYDEKKFDVKKMKEDEDMSMNFVAAQEAMKKEIAAKKAKSQKDKLGLSDEEFERLTSTTKKNAKKIEDQDDDVKKMILGSKNSDVNNNNNNGKKGALSIAEEQERLALQRRNQYLYETRDIDIECLMAAMTSIASNTQTPSKDRMKFLGKLCTHLDRQISQLPALRSQSLARQSFQQQQQKNNQNQNDNNNNNKITASIAANSTRALPLSSLTKMLGEVAANNLPVFSIFRTCGKCYSAPGALLHMSPVDAVTAISAYAAFSFRDDFVIRSLGLRCYALKNSISKNPRLAEQCAAAMKVFHINFDPRSTADGGQGKREQSGMRRAQMRKEEKDFFTKSQQTGGSAGVNESFK